MSWSPSRPAALLALLLLLAPGRGAAGPAAPGAFPPAVDDRSTLLLAPSELSWRWEEIPGDPLERARVLYQRGELPRAARLLLDFYEGRRRAQRRVPRSRALLGRFLLGWLERRLGAWNLASEQFTRVRAGSRSLAPFAAYLEAEADYRRGRAAVAARECAAYRRQWPRGFYAEDCARLRVRALAAAGQRAAAEQALAEWLREEPGDPAEESLRLALALALAEREPQRALAPLQSLLLDHDYATTGAAAEQALAALGERGLDTGLPPGPATLVARAWSDGRSGDVEAAGAGFDALAADDTPGGRALAAQNLTGLAWVAHRYSWLARHYAERYEQAPDGETCYRAFRTHLLGGDWQGAADWGERCLAAHPTHRRWRHGEEAVARAEMLAGRYGRARERWDRLGRSATALGREARWAAALCAFLAGDGDAARRLEAVAAEGRETAPRARYFRARLDEREGRLEEARARYAALLADEPTDYYGLLAAARLGERPGGGAREGRWPGGEVPVPLPWPRTAPEAEPPPLALARPAGAELPPPRDFRWDALARAGASRPAEPPPAEPPPAEPAGPPRAEGPEPPYPLDTPADSYVPSAWYDPGAAREALATFARRWAPRWPDLPAALLLADAGVYELSGEILARLREDWERAPGSLRMGNAEWRPLFLYTRDHHHVSRFCMGLDRYAGDEAARLAALRLAYPAAYATSTWRWARAYDLDPLLLLGLMRQESLYRSTALSRKGAVGVMQIIPRTGARIARDLGEWDFSPEELEEPDTSIRYGAWYLSRLLARFGGSLPLAVAAYNAGPLHASTWLHGLRGHPLDELVELIPFDETRNYTRRVLSWYALYVQLYAPPGSRVALCLEPPPEAPEGIAY